MDPVKVTLQDIKSGAADKYLDEAFGPSSLGIIVVSGLDEKFPELRSRLLTLGHLLANSPASQLTQWEDPDSHYLVGWSRGREKLQNGLYDVNKGSFYANCNFHAEPGSLGPPLEIQQKYPMLKSYTASNIWPSIPGAATESEFREAFEALCNYILTVTEHVAAACDRYYHGKAQYPPHYIENVVKTSYTTKARLLNYYPTANADDWCGMHVDHSCLTALCSAMYFGGMPAPESGLFIQSRNGEMRKVAIPPDCLAFQTGLALESITEGLVRAVPHVVKGSAANSTTSRTTLALFCQPSLHQVVEPKTRETFATFATKILQKNH